MNMKKNAFLGMIATIAILFTSSAAMAWGPGHGWRPSVGMGYGGMTIFWILAIIAVVCLICFAIYLSRKCARNKKKESLLDILSQRHAKGEITKEEFDRKKKDLKEDSYLDNQIQLDSLCRRYARGEITKEEFDGKTKDLREESLLAILIPRYARGEITKEEFKRIKKDSEELCNAC
jgi:putative membrane protein